MFRLGWVVGLENHSRPYLFRCADVGEDDSISGARVSVCM